VRFVAGGLRAVDATLALAVFGGSASCNIAIEFGVYGPNSTNGMSCASGTIAVGDGFRSIRDGYADVMICGGSEAPLSTLCFGAFALIRAMSTRNDDPGTASRPFDRDRDGFVMGEGAAVLVLEERDRALGILRTQASAHQSAPHDVVQEGGPVPGGREESPGEVRGQRDEKRGQARRHAETERAPVGVVDPEPLEQVQLSGGIEADDALIPEIVQHVPSELGLQPQPARVAQAPGHGLELAHRAE